MVAFSAQVSDTCFYSFSNGAQDSPRDRPATVLVTSASLGTSRSWGPQVPEATSTSLVTSTSTSTCTFTRTARLQREPESATENAARTLGCRGSRRPTSSSGHAVQKEKKTYPTPLAQRAPPQAPSSGTLIEKSKETYLTPGFVSDTRVPGSRSTPTVRPAPPPCDLGALGASVAAQHLCPGTYGASSSQARTARGSANPGPTRCPSTTPW